MSTKRCLICGRNLPDDSGRACEWCYPDDNAEAQDTLVESRVPCDQRQDSCGKIRYGLYLLHDGE